MRHRSVGYIPEDRQTTGVIAAFSVTENLVLNVTHLENIAQWNILNEKKKRETAENLIADYDIRPPNPDIPASALSGGNQQKIVIAREISLQPDLLIAVNPDTRFRCQCCSLCTRESVGTTREKEICPLNLNGVRRSLTVKRSTLCHVERQTHRSNCATQQHRSTRIVNDRRMGIRS